MNSPPGLNADPKRDATNSIRGYVYQIYQSVLAWMQLKEDEILVLEGAEDFDIHCGSSVTTFQVKDVTRNLTLRAQEIVDSLNNYWACIERNPDFNIFLRFLTTAEAAQEHGFPFGPGKKGLEYWQRAELDHIDIGPLREFLLKLELSTSLTSFMQSATDDELRENLIRRIKWDMGNRPREALQYIIEDKLKNHGFKLKINSHYSCQALPNLLKKVADLLTTKGKKELRFGDFLSCFDDATTVSIPRGELEMRASCSNMQQLAGQFDLAEMSRLENSPTSIGKPVPIVDGGIPRENVVSNLTNLLREQRVIFLCGSSGLGKTNLATLICHEIGGDWGWTAFRGIQCEKTKHVLGRAAFELNTASIPPFLVLDDVDLSQVSLFEREFISLVFAVTNTNGMVIVTGTNHPPLQLLPKLWKSETCEVTVPYFDETEVAEMVRAHGFFDSKIVSEWARTIWLTTSGHPQLIHARVRNLSAKGWPSNEVSNLTNLEDVKRIRSDARDRLVNEIPTENTRVLAYRLSLLKGAFSRETAIAVAETPPPTKLPGEVFDALIGPWIEREEENRFRISPLLNGAANNVLSKAEIKAVHGAIALSTIGRKIIDQFEFGTAFYHAYKANNTKLLVNLADKVTTSDSKNTYLLYDAMSWFTLVGLENGQKILSENPSIDLMFRLAQYKLITSAPESDKAISIIKRIEETLQEIQPSESKQDLEVLAYGVILNTFEVQIPSSIVIRMLSRLIDLAEENIFFKNKADSFAKKHTSLPRIGENKPAQVHFSFQAVRLSGLDDLFELLTSLDALPSYKREQLLMVCNSDIDFAPILVNRAWLKEVKDGVLDINKALRVFDFTVIKSREWKVPELTKAGFVAMSVIQDEYGHSTEGAIEVLNVADKEFPDEASLVNQRAKVLFHANRDSEALPIAYKALELPGLSDVEFVFCCRVAGIATAKSGDWAEAERLFLLGAKKAKSSSVQKGMGVGLTADAAFALWKQKKYKDSLLLLAETLDLLGTIPLSENIRIRYLHAAIPYSIAWIHFKAKGEHPTDFVEPRPGMCSSQEPHQEIKDHRIVDISAVWELLAITEPILELDIGLKERAQAATGDRKLLLIKKYDRTIAFESIFKNKAFENLIPNLIGLYEAFHHSKTLGKGEKDEWSIGDVPKLPDGYWGRSGSCDIIYRYILAASIICTADNQAISFPIARWRTDLDNGGALPNEVDRFLSVLNGAHSDGSLYQEAAATIFALRNGTVSPVDLWKGSFCLLNAFMIEKRWVETALESLLIERWIFAVNNQRFAFSTQPLAFSEIEKYSLDRSLSGLAKIAAVLDVAAPYLNIQLPTDTKQMIEKIKSN